MVQRSSIDVLILGAGPAGVAIASACAREGLGVLCVSADLSRPWTHNYGVWSDELKGTGLEDTLGAAWPQVGVRTAEHDTKIVQRAYGWVDNARLRERLWAGAEVHGARFEAVPRAAVYARFDPTGADLTLGDRTLRARVVVDATGHAPALVRRAPWTDPAAQTAFGMRVVADGAPKEAWLMDFGGGEGASFLYALPFPDGTVLLEETSLVGRPPVPLAVLDEALRSRLQRDGVVIREILDVERCFLPMDPPLPDLAQPVIGFGAAASLTSPLSGYTLGRTLALAAPVAWAIAEGLARGGPAEASRLAWATLWPWERRQTRALHRYGQRAVLGMSGPQLRGFFAAFFGQPEPVVADWLSDRLGVLELSLAMLKMFGDAPPEVRRAVLGPAIPSFLSPSLEVS